LNDYQQKDNFIVKTEVMTEIDTVFVRVVDTVHVTRTEIKHEQVRDTVLIEPFEPIISKFKTSKPFLYGNTYVSGEVFGEVLKMDIVNDFNIPTVTNTITKTNTIIKKPSGLFLTAGVNSNFSTQYQPYFGAIFIKDKYLLGLNTSGFQIGYKVQILSK
jgi:hypothetical protein